MDTPFYEEWWFLLVVALSSLIVILLVAFTLVLHGQNKKYKNCGTGGLSALVSPLLRVPWAPELQCFVFSPPGSAVPVSTFPFHFL